MKLIGVSLVLFVMSVILLGAVTLLEANLVVTSTGAERGLTFVMLVLPAGAGAVLAGLSLFRREGRAWGAIALLVLNSLFALFHLMIVLFAG